MKKVARVGRESGSSNKRVIKLNNIICTKAGAMKGRKDRGKKN